MSFIDTLDRLVATLAPLVPGVTLLDRPVDIYAPVLPSINLFPLTLRTTQVWPGERGQGDGDPAGQQNIYGYVYLHAPADVTGETKHAAVSDMYAAVAVLDAAFARRSVRLLMDAQGTPQVLSAGDLFEATFDPQGPYLRYLDQLFIGCYGRVSVRELFTPEDYDR